MVPFDDQEETQIVHIDSPSSGDPIDEDNDQSAIPLEETLPIDSFFETEVVREDTILYGETQALEEEEEDPEIDNWVRTQVLDDEYEETAAVENGDEETEGTEVVSDGEQGLSDDGATTTIEARVCGDGTRNGEEEGEEEEKRGNEEGKRGSAVDSDASTDEEGGGTGDHVSSELLLSGGSCKSNNGSVRSFTAVRAASLRFSGLAAARSITSKTIGTESKSSFSNGENCKNQDNGVGGQTGTRASGMETWPKSTTDLTLLGIKAGEIDRDHETDNSHKYTQDYHRDETKSRINNPRVKKLFTEMTSAEEETMSKPNSAIGKVDPPRSFIPDYGVTGLSYIGSQEPSDMSQANALDVVDKFLLVNDMGSSQEANTGKTDMVKSPPFSSAKGAQCLAKKADHRSPVGKEGIYEWIDSLEDEGGGEFFSKRKDSFFESKGGARKSHSQPPKSRHVGFGIGGEAAVHKIGEAGVNPKTHRKIMNLTRSDSRLMLHSSFRNEKVHVSETKTKKNLFKDLNEQSNSKSLVQQLEVTDVERGGEGIYEVGPDTQMAAEAMEALVHGSPINYEKNDAHPVGGKLANITGEVEITMKTSTKNAPLRKSTSSTPNSEGISTRSKRRMMLCTKPRRGSPSFARRNTRGKKSLEGTMVKTKAKREKRKVERNLNATSSVNENESSVSFKEKKALGTVDRTLIKEVDKCHSSLTLNVQLSVSKELILGEFHVNSAPVAHRTRKSKAVKLSKQTDDYGKNTNGLIDVRTCGVIAREDKLAADDSGSLKMKRKGSYIDSDRTAEVERNFTSHTEAHDIGGQHEEEPKASSLVKGAFTHPKRRRTSQITSGNPNINDNLNVSVDSMKPSTRHGKIKATVKSVSEMLDTAKRKKRSVSTHMLSETDGMPSDGRRATFISGVRTRSSVNFTLFKPSLENGSKERLARPDLYRACSTDADLISHVEVPEENAKLEGSPKEKLKPSGLACTTPSKDIDAVSPVCMAQERPRASGNKGLSRSFIARELIRLEASEASPTWTFNTRRRKDMASVRVLCSHHLNEDIIKQQKKIMGRLGVPVASSISDATHFVTDKFVRTRNMLEAIALGKPVVTHMWLESCGQASCFIDEKNYILRDAKKEKEIGFSMPVSLARACQCPLLQGRRVYITPNTKPDRELISSLVKAAHGQPMERIGRSAMKDDKIPDDLLVLSCEEDYAICIPLLEKGAEVFSSELLLNGIVIQKLEYTRHRLFLDHVKRTRSTIWLRQEVGNQFLPVTKCT